MKKHLPQLRFLHSTRAALVTWLLLSAVTPRMQAEQVPASTDTSTSVTQSAPVRIEHVFHVVGLESKPGTQGDLAFDDQAMTFNVSGHSISIPFRSILMFSIVPCDKPLIHGTKGKLAESAPYGVGLAVSLTRPSAESLTLFYKDSDQAIHGGILILPKDSGERILSAVGAKLSLSDYPKTGQPSPVEPERSLVSPMASAPAMTKPSVEVTLPSESVNDIPLAFPAAIYENLIEQLKQSGLFANVWSAGSVQRTADTLVLRLEIEEWKKGSARGRSFGPFTGTTSIKSAVTLKDRSGRIIFQGKINGSKRMKGENLDATIGLAKHVRKALEKTAELQATK